jgi:hypothetical protein
MNCFQIYGINLRTDIRLFARHRAEETPDDLCLRLEEVDDIPVGSPPGLLLSGIRPENSFGQSLTLNGDRFTLRFNGLAEFVWERNSREARCRLKRGSDVGWASSLAASSFFSTWLAVSGKIPIHAGVIEWRSRAYAFVGHSNQGKTTLSHAACLAGARLISDDVLVFDRHGTRVEVLAGSLQLRLRAEGRAPAGAIEQMSVDQRHCFCFTDAPARTELSAILIPWIQADCSAPWIERLAPLEAFKEMAQFPRVLGQGMPDYRIACFREYAAIAESIPVARIHMPRGLQRQADFPDRVAAWLDEYSHA